MEHKVNPHNLRVGVIRDWNSRWNLDNSKTVCIDRINDSLKNLYITRDVRVFGYNSSDVERIVKTMKKR